MRLNETSFGSTCNWRRAIFGRCSLCLTSPEQQMALWIYDQTLHELSLGMSRGGCFFRSCWDAQQPWLIIYELAFGKHVADKYWIYRFAPQVPSPQAEWRGIRVKFSVILRRSSPFLRFMSTLNVTSSIKRAISETRSVHWLRPN